MVHPAQLIARLPLDVGGTGTKMVRFFEALWEGTISGSDPADCEGGVLSEASWAGEWGRLIASRGEILDNTTHMNLRVSLGCASH